MTFRDTITMKISFNAIKKETHIIGYWIGYPMAVPYIDKKIGACNTQTQTVNIFCWKAFQALLTTLNLLSSMKQNPSLCYLAFDAVSD